MPDILPYVKVLLININTDERKESYGNTLRGNSVNSPVFFIKWMLSRSLLITLIPVLILLKALVAFRLDFIGEGR